MDDIGHVVVIGCGRVGSGLARRITEAGGTVAVIDRDPGAFRRLAGVDAQQVTGVGFDRAVLEAAGVERARSVAAVTNGDNSNIVVARVAREAFGVDHVVARIYDPRRAALYERLGITTIATVGWTIERIVTRLSARVDDSAWIDPGGRLAMVERRVPESWVGHPAAHLDRFDRYRLVAVSRLGETRFPKPDLVLQEGDVAHVAVDVAAVDELDAALAAGPGEAS